MKCAAVVIWYNPTKEECNNIYTYLSGVDKLYIFDNSDNPTILENNSKIDYIFNGKNLGISKCLNAALDMCIKEEYKWLLTMDQDTEMNDKCMKRFADIIRDVDCKKIAIITPWHNTKLDDKKPTTKIDNPNEVMTSGNLVNVSLLKKIGGYDERFFIDGIDIEIGLRINKLGYKILRFNDISIKHNLGDICYHKFLWRTFMCTNHNYLRQYYMARNYRYIRDDYIKDYPEFCKILVKEKQNIFKIIMFEKDKIRKLFYKFKGVIDYKRGVKGKLEVKNGKRQN